MNHQRKLTVTAAALAALVVMGGCSPSGSADAAAPSDDALADLEPITLILAELDGETGSSAVAMRAWMDEVTENTDGKVTFETFYSGSLIPATELVSGLSSGLADIGFIHPPLAPEQIPVADWGVRVDEVTLPEGYPLVGFSALINAAERPFAEGAHRDEFAAQNLVPLTAAAYSFPNQLLCSKPVTTPEDAEGLIVRVGGQPWLDAVSSIGISAVNIPFNEIYESLQRGVVDCVMTSPSSFLPTGVLELGTHLMLLEAGSGIGAAYAFNKDSWDSLPLVVQQIMFDAIPVTYVEHAKALLDQHQELVEVAAAQDIEILDVPGLNEAMREHRAELRERVADMAPPEVSDPDGFIDHNEASIEAANDFIRNELGITDATSFEEKLAAYRSGSESIDWNRFREHISALLAPYRPE